MIVEVDLPDELVDELCRASKASSLTAGQYASEMLFQVLTERSLGEGALLGNNPDWQAKLERSQADRKAGRVVSHQDVVAWHKGHGE